MSDEMYYRILADGDNISVATMQWFDEHDYDQKRFITDEHFASEDEAWAWVDLQRSQNIAWLRARDTNRRGRQGW